MHVIGDKIKQIYSTHGGCFCPQGELAHWCAQTERDQHRIRVHSIYSQIFELSLEKMYRSQSVSAEIYAQMFQTKYLQLYLYCVLFVLVH